MAGSITGWKRAKQQEANTGSGLLRYTSREQCKVYVQLSTD